MMRGSKLIGGVVALICSGHALAGPWTAPNGETAQFFYSNGQDINGLFGNPNVTGNLFVFQTSFLANASEGSTQSFGDTVSFDVVAKPGLLFSTISVFAGGEYTVTGDPLENSVDVTALLSLDENDGDTRHFDDALVTDVGFPVTSGSGFFNGSASVDVSNVFPSPSNNLHIELNNDILAISGPGGTATISITFEALSIEFGIIPEPASLSILAVGAGLLVRRRRR